MSEYFDSDDPFEDVTAEDLDTIEHEALVATQGYTQGYTTRQPALRQRLPISRSTSFQNAVPPVQQDSNMEDDYGHFNVDDEDLVLVDQADFPSFPAPTQDHHRSSITNDALLEELVHLRAETARLKQERNKFETLAYSQEGKMDHLQRTLSKSRAEYEAALLRLQNATEADKRTFQNAIAERDRRLTALTADIEFQRNELREAQELANRGTTIRTTNNIQLTSPQRPARVVKGSGVKSPEAKSRIGRSSAMAFRKDEEVLPAKNRKRKRGEPVPEKYFVMVEESESSGLSEGDINRIVMEKVFSERSSWTAADERFELIRDILAHRMMDGIETFAALSTMTFKTENHAISSILIHEITTRAVDADNESNLAKLLSHVLSEQWNRCLKEEVYTPLIYLQSLINFLLLQNYSTCAYCLKFTPSPIHLSQSTIELHASKRIYNKDTPQLPYPAVTSSFDILYTIACGLPTDDNIVHFWEILSVNFTVMSLHTKQLVVTIEGMAKLLGVSVTSDGFGPRGEFEDDGVQRDPVALVLDKLTLNLIEEPRAGSSKEELWHLRQTIIETMSELVAGHSHGSKILHSSGYVLSRLIGLLANEIEYYYAHPTDAAQSIGLSKSCVRLLHAVIMPHSPDTLSHHLSPFPGAQQAHNVAMTRLSFGGESETVFIDVADMARDLLEAAVSPEEGDGIWSLFQWGEEMDEDDAGEDLSAFMM